MLGDSKIALCISDRAIVCQGPDTRNTIRAIDNADRAIDKAIRAIGPAIRAIRCPGTEIVSGNPD